MKKSFGLAKKKTYPVRVERGTKPKPIYWKEAFSRQTFSLAFNKTINLNALNKYQPNIEHISFLGGLSLDNQ